MKHIASTCWTIVVREFCRRQVAADGMMAAIEASADAAVVVVDAADGAAAADAVGAVDGGGAVDGADANGTAAIDGADEDDDDAVVVGVQDVDGTASQNCYPYP